MIVRRCNQRAIHAALLAAAWIVLFGLRATGTTAAETLAGPAPADQVVAEIEVPDGFRTTLFASEPDVQQPIGIATDERGRLWVAENYTYADETINFDETKRDRIVILEDSDGDGRSDCRKVFWDQAQKLTSVEVGYGGVWILCAPQLLFIPDRNRDDVPDGPPEVVLDGWDQDAVRHNIVNGLKWGPDGWLYGRHGILATSLVGKPGDAESQRQRINCGVWRYHPIRRVFEVVAHGTTNPWGFDFDEHGEMFFINTVIGHLWHLVPGAHYERMFGADLSPNVYGLIGQTADHVHWDTGEKWNDIHQGVSDTTSQAGGGHAHSGLMIYQGDNWPERYRNSMFTLNFHGRRLNNDRLQRRGTGYVGLHSEDLFFVKDEWFRGIDLLSGADGSVFIADWSDTGECHEADGVHHASGRIYRLAWGSPPSPGKFDLSEQSDRQLVELQLAKNDWYVRQSRRILAERHAVGKEMAEARAALLEMFNTQRDETGQLRAMWALTAIGAADDEWLRQQLKHPGEHVRAWTIRLLADRETMSAKTADEFAELAAAEPSGLVRLYLAAAMQRMPDDGRWRVGAALASKIADADDPQLPLMIWYGLEPATPEDPARALALCEQPIIPLIRRYLARRITSGIDGNGPCANRLVELVGANDDPAFQLDILHGMSDALRGRRRVAVPTAWNAAAAKLMKSPSGEVQEETRQLGVVFGDGWAVGDLLAIAAEPSADADARRNAIRTLVADGGPETLALLKNLINDVAVSNECMRGLAAYDDSAIPALVLGRFSYLDPAGQSLAVETLASRPMYAKVLLDAVTSGAIDRSAISASHARQIAGFGDEQLTAALEHVWGAVRATADDKREQIERLRSLLEGSQRADVDASRGRFLFEKTCSNCHVLYGQGKLVGPDLTGSNRHNLNYLLENIVDPSASVGKEFQTTAILLSSGRAISGVVVGKTDQTITLRTQTEEVAVDLADVEEMVEQEVSLMPDGLLTQMTDEQIGDLFAYLRSTSQAPLPDE